MQRIVWLASYPKSGNTWFRIFLTNLQNVTETPVSINDLGTHGIASSRYLFDEFSGIAASDFKPEEIERVRPEVYRCIAEAATDPLYVKVHDAYTTTPAGEPLFPAEVTQGVVYLLRNPLDVAVSFAHHEGTDVEAAIQRMGCPNAAFCNRPDRLSSQLQQKLLTWSQHVLSWVNQTALPLHVMRYEDMKTHAVEVFTHAARFCGFDQEETAIQRALMHSDFKELKRQEEELSFREKGAKAQNFFRKGEIGSWRETLTPMQVERIIHDHADVMKRFGYLDAEGDPTF